MSIFRRGFVAYFSGIGYNFIITLKRGSKDEKTSDYQRKNYRTGKTINLCPRHGAGSGCRRVGGEGAGGAQGGHD